MISPRFQGPWRQSLSRQSRLLASASPCRRLGQVPLAVTLALPDTWLRQATEASLFSSTS